MSKTDRFEIISKIEEMRGSRVISYVTGDRQNLETKIGMDVFPFFYDLLKKIGKVEKLDLVLYTPGGVTMAGWGLVNVMREFCSKFSVLVPFKAYSTGTLICLGANEIVMGRLGQLSPIDPSVQSPYNPQIQNKFLPVSVEDVVGFLDLARKEAELESEESRREVFAKLTSDVRPMALGNVYRAREQIGMLAKKLLSLHIKPRGSKKKDSIIRILTRERYSHDYLISRQEAKNEIGLKVLDPVDENLEFKLMELYNEYAATLELQTPYLPDLVLGSENEKQGTFKRAYVESRDGSYVFVTKRLIKRVMVAQQGMPAPVEMFQERTLKEGWEIENE